VLVPKKDILSSYSFIYVQLPQRSVEVTAIKQRLLSQYDMLQSRITDLKEAAEKEVCILHDL
jgi:hypothetical protein